MNVSTSIPARVEIRRGRLLGLLGAVAAVAAVVTWSIGAVAFDSGSSSATSVRASIATASSAAPETGRVPSIMTLTPARLAGGALGTGYQLPTAHEGPTVASVLASMSPQTRSYTQAVMDLTFAQLAAGAAGHP